MDLIQYLNHEFQIQLNQQQIQAVLSDEKNILLLAVPGSGKTTVLVSRIAKLLLNDKIDASRILTLTFSRASAKDMGERFSRLFGPLGISSPRFSTIHSFCYTILKYYSRRYQRSFPTLIADASGEITKGQMLRQIYQQVCHDYLADDLLESLSNDISLAKNLHYTKSEIKQMQSTVEPFFELYQAYETAKKENHMMDYDDILIFALEILQKLPSVLSHFQKQYTYIQIDEAQDTSKIQYEIIHLFSKTTNLFLVGDEDQCIYSFRGAYPEGLLRFQQDYDDTVVLKIEKNYRSNCDIVREANLFIQGNQARYQKNMFCDNQREGSIEFIELEDYSQQYREIEKLLKQENKNHSVAILYRNHESVVPVLDILNRLKIPYIMREHNLKFFHSFVVKDILSFFKLSYHAKDIKAFQQIYYKCMCSKTVFLFVKENIQYFSSVFEAAANCAQVPSYLKTKLLEYHKCLLKLKDKPPFVAIGWIQEKLGYDKYLSKRCSSGNNPVNAALKLNILKTIAREHQTIDTFVDRLMQLELQLQQGNQDGEDAWLTLSSIHSSKGLEFDTVILLDMLESILPNQHALDYLDEGQTTFLEDEARLFYVAITRAKSRLVIYTAAYCNDEPVVKSQFVARLQKEIPVLTSNLGTSDAQLQGREVWHKFFGAGVIVEELERDIVKIYFFKHGCKNISYQSCLESNLLKINSKVKSKGIFSL